MDDYNKLESKKSYEDELEGLRTYMREDYFFASF